MSAAPTPMITPDNCPRDEAGLRLLSRVVRYRLALNMEIFPSESPQEAAFAGADENTQIQTLLTALQARDQHMANGQPPPGQQYAPPPQVAVPAPLTPQPLVPAQGQYAPPPGQYAPPPQYPPQQMAPAPQQPPPPQAPPQPQYAMPPQYAPQAPTAPSMPPAPQAAPPQYAMPPSAPQYPPQPAAAQQAPQYQPPPPQMAPPPAYAPPPMALPQMAQPQQPPQPQYQQQPPPPAPMMRQPSTMGDPGNTGAQSNGISSDRAKIIELENAVLGMARTQNMMFNLLLELGQNQLGLDKQTLAMRLIQHAQAGEPMRFFDAGVTQGKAG